MRKIIFSVLLISSVLANTFLLSVASEHTNPKSIKPIVPIENLVYK